MTTQRTELSELGEFGLIEALSQNVKSYQKSTLLGIGDDASVLEQNESTYRLVSSDMLVEGVHFDLSYVPLKHLGYKAVAVNISDIAAMNGKPTQILVNIAVSNRFSFEAIQEIYEGINFACENYHVDLVGGDTTTSPSGLVLSITAIGEVKKENVSYRKGAKPNDILCVTGDLGAAYLGLQLLEQEKQVFLVNPEMQPQLEGKDYLVKRQLKPEARTDIIHELEEKNVVPTAMIDISDGLASELMHICKNSEVGAVIFEDKIPFHSLTHQTAMDFKISPTTAALNGGEDYELLLTIDQKDFPKIEKYDFVIPIGYMTEAKQGVLLRTIDESLIPIEAQGWKHF